MVQATKFEDMAGLGGNEPIRQGDVLVPVQAGMSAFQGFVVMTADCDLTHDKFGGHLTALPLVSVAQYVRDHWLPRVMATLGQQLEEEILADLSVLIDASPRRVARPSPEHVVRWAIESESSAIAETLGVDDAEMTRINLLAAAVRGIHAAAESGLRTKWASCIEAMVAMGTRSQDRAAAALAKRISQELPRQLPGDVFYVHDIGRGEDVGYLALARKPVSIPPEKVALVPSDLTYDSPDFRRVGRLDSPYRYRLTQLYGEVFAAIGLPSEYEVVRNTSFGMVAARLSGEPNEH